MAHGRVAHGAEGVPSLGGTLVTMKCFTGADRALYMCDFDQTMIQLPLRVVNNKNITIYATLTTLQVFKRVKFE